MTAALRVRSPAKLNLFLHVLGRREDGYHDLQTLFQFIDLCDDMEFEVTGDPAITLEGPDFGIVSDHNLIVRAAHALQQATGSAMGARIRIDKHIPLGGGLGGGSSNAATTLVALNHLWGTGLNTQALKRIGVGLGADVPIFIHGRAALAEGVGEIFTDAAPPEPWYVLALPDCHVPTGVLFQQKQLTRNSPRITLADFLAGARRNDFEPVTRQLFAEVDRSFATLANLGQVQMTGTGACLFAPFPTQETARQAAEVAATRFSQQGSRTRVLVTKGLNGSPLFDDLPASGHP